MPTIATSQPWQPTGNTLSTDLDDLVAALGFDFNSLSDMDDLILLLYEKGNYTLVFIGDNITPPADEDSLTAIACLRAKTWLLKKLCRLSGYRTPYP